MTSPYENIIVMGKSGAGKQPRIDVLTEVFRMRQLSTGNIFRTYLDRFNELGYADDLNRFYSAESNDFISEDQIKAVLCLAENERADDIVLGLKAKYFINQGLYVPDTITNALFESAFREMGYRGAVLDGYPRTYDQARFLKELADQKDIHLDAILLVDNDDESILNRTAGRRICSHCGKVYHIDYNLPPAGGCGGDENRACELIQRSDDTPERLEARLQEFYTKTRPAIDYLAESGIPLHRIPGNLPVFTPASVKASVFEAMRIG